MKRNRNMMMDYLIDDFMMYCKEKDLRPKTIFSYETTLRLFTRYIKDNFNIENITDVKEETVKDYISYTKERGKYTIISNKNTSYINIPKNRWNSNINICWCIIRLDFFCSMDCVFLKKCTFQCRKNI